jgi:hypothetical protein
VNLGAGLRAVFLGEEDVVVLAGVEGRVEIDEIDGLVLDVALEDFEIVAVIELVDWVESITEGRGVSLVSRAASLVLLGNLHQLRLVTCSESRPGMPAV